jgi:uncharacterized protein (DUF1778 family)
MNNKISTKKSNLNFKLNQQEKIILQNNAKKFNMSITDYVKFCTIINPPEIISYGAK